MCRKIHVLLGHGSRATRHAKLYINVLKTQYEETVHMPSRAEPSRATPEDDQHTPSLKPSTPNTLALIHATRSLSVVAKENCTHWHILV